MKNFVALISVLFAISIGALSHAQVLNYGGAGNASQIQGIVVSTVLPINNQVLTYNSSAMQWSPATASGSSGTITSITAGTGATGGTITSTGTIGVDVGTGASKIVQLTAAAKYPAVDGNLITNANAANIRGKNISSTAPTSGQVLTYNSVATQWEAQTASGSFADLALSNLSSVAINASLLPGASGVIDLGSASKQWSLAYISSIYSGSTNSVDVSGRTLRDSSGGQALDWSNSSAILFNTDLKFTTSNAVVQTADASSGSPSANINILTGRAVDTPTGGIFIQTQDSDDGASGPIDIRSGNAPANNNTGQWLGGTGDTSGNGNSGQFGFGTGGTVNGNSGLLLFNSGGSSGITGNLETGSISFSTGQHNSVDGGQSGNMLFETGDSPYQSGSIQIVTGDGASTSSSAYTGTIELATGSVAGSAHSGKILIHPGGADIAASHGVILLGGHLSTDNSQVDIEPVLSACGTNPTVVGNDMAGTITVGTGVSTTSCTLTFGYAYVIVPTCVVVNNSALQLIRAAPTASALVITSATSFSTNTMSYVCFGHDVF